VQQAGSCCPNLRYAKLGKCGRVESVQADDERLIAAGLSAIQVGWSQLRMLRLDDPLPGVIPGRPLWEALGGFSALGYLRIQINSPWADEPEAAHVLCLEGCKELRHLEIDVRAVNAPVVSNGFRSWKLELHSTVRAAMSARVC
jgi:hypothetical protein